MVSMQQEKSSRVRSSASVGSLGGRHGAEFWSSERASGSVGVKLLERMGWQEGKGLGKGEGGTQSFVRAKLKNDTVGIGAKKGAAGDDRQHVFAQATTDMFNALLSKLNAAHSTAATDTAAEDKQGEVEKAEAEQAEEEEEDTSTARDAAASIDRYVRKRHLYGRFSRAKDTSLYSQKSKLEIFGRKQRTAAADTAYNGQSGQLTAVAVAAKGDGESSSTEQREQEPPLSTTTTTTSSVSIQSYFASKMTARQQQAQLDANGSAAWQSALFDDMNGRTNVGRAGLGARTANSNTHTHTNFSTGSGSGSKPASSAAAVAPLSVTGLTLPSSASPAEHREADDEQHNHKHKVAEAGENEDEDEAERKKRRRARKEARRVEKEQTQQQEQHRQAGEEVQSAAEESAEEKKRRKKRKREQAAASKS